MQIKRTLLATTLAAFMLLGSGGTGSAAIPCLEVETIYHTASSHPDAAKQWQPLTLAEALAGDGPLDRTNAVELTGVEASAPISAVENVLRCLDYGNDTVLETHADNTFREQTLGMVGDFEYGDLLADFDGGVYTERIHSAYQVGEDRYIVEFTFSSDNLAYQGEFELMAHNDDLYLHDSYLQQLVELDERHEVVISSTDEPEPVTAGTNDTIRFDLEMQDTAEITIVNAETGEVVFEGNERGDGAPGAAPRNSWIVLDAEPGTYTATISLREADTNLEVQIEIEP